MPSKLDDLVFEDARIMFRNFAGLEKQFNSAGDRNFCLMLEPAQAERMIKDGWNVKTLRPREEGDEPQHYIPVAVNYDKGRPPRVVLLTRRGTQRQDLGAEEVQILDFADIKTIDVILNPYSWTMGEKTGVKAYLKSAFVTLNEDELEMKYADVPMGPTATSSTASDE